jgi:hypothetical protein
MSPLGAQAFGPLPHMTPTYNSKRNSHCTLIVVDSSHSFTPMDDMSQAHLSLVIVILRGACSTDRMSIRSSETLITSNLFTASPHMVLMLACRNPMVFLVCLPGSTEMPHRQLRHFNFQFERLLAAAPAAARTRTRGNCNPYPRESRHKSTDT